MKDEILEGGKKKQQQKHTQQELSNSSTESVAVWSWTMTAKQTIRLSVHYDVG